MPSNVKNTTIIGLFDLLAPHSCRGCGSLGYPLCDCCKKYIISTHKNYCPNCKAENPTGKCPDCPDLPPVFVVGPRDGLIGVLIHDFKFSSVRTLALPLAEILDAIFPVSSAERSSDVFSLIPLPTIQKHIRERGLDHTYQIAKHLVKLRRARGQNIKIEKLLARAKNTVQVGSDAETRKTQASSAYALSKNAKIDPEKTYILLDDVWTTGASIHAAYKKLQAAGAKKFIFLILAVNRLD